MTRTLAIDAATVTGFAHNCGAVRSGFKAFDVKRGESPGMRFRRFREWLTATVQDLQPELIVFERPERFKSGAAAAVALGLIACVQEVAAVHQIDHTPVGPSTLKKWATGNGNAKKPEMVAEACRRFYPVTDNNEADALLILAWALAGRPDPAQRVARQAAAKAEAASTERARRTVTRDASGWGAALRKAGERRATWNRSRQVRGFGSWSEGYRLEPASDAVLLVVRHDRRDAEWVARCLARYTAALEPHFVVAVDGEGLRVTTKAEVTP